MDARYTLLIDELKRKSKNGLIEWTPTGLIRTYQTKIGNGSITIMFDDSYDAESPVDYEAPIASMSFFNERKEVFHQINCFCETDKEFEDLKDIYNSAHNNYMKIGETLKSMFTDLSNRK